MNTVRIYIDENLDTSRLQGLKQLIKDIPHVVDVAISEKEPHEVVVDYEEQQNMPVKLIEVLRKQGYHPDILSA
jgi:hypothetical protein